MANDKAKNGMMMYKPNNNNKKSRQDSFKMMFMQRMIQNCKDGQHSRENQMQLHNLDKNYMDQ
eukprot:1378324-Ditylum_brightwellii.AAC.1